MADYPPTEKLRLEKELVGFYLSDHPLKQWNGALQLLAPISLANLEEQPDRAKIDALFAQRGCRVANGSFSVRFDSGRHAWRFVAVEVDRRRVCSMTQLSHDLSDLEGLEAFEIGHARN